MRQRSDMRQYQVRASDKLYHGVPVRDKNTGIYTGVSDWYNPTTCTIVPVSDVRDGVAIHIDMGLGKTIIALTAIADWFSFGVISRPVLVVAPIKVCETVWRQEAKGWAHTAHLTFTLVRGTEKQRAFALNPRNLTHVYLINPEQLKWLATYLRNDWSFFHAMLIDESSMFKDNRSKRFRVLSNYGTQVALKSLNGSALRDTEGHTIKVPPHRFKRAGILTGTPSPSSALNLWSPFYLIDHGARLHKKFDSYQSRFFHKAAEVAEHIHKYEINSDEAESRPEYIARAGSPERIHELIADITVELDAADYGVLPKTMGDLSKVDYAGNTAAPGSVFYKPQPHYSPAHVHHVDLPPELMKLYKQLEKEAVLELDKDPIMAANGGAKSMMCWQMANGAIYRNDELGRQHVEELHTAKLDKLSELLYGINSNTIVTYYFRHDLARIRARLEKEGIDYAVLAGSKTERTVERWNEGRTSVLLLHPQSAGHGLNLQFGGHSFVWFTMLWSLERYLQTNARLARSGQLGVVGIHSIIARNTTDEMMAINLGLNGDDQTRFRQALRGYQELRGMGLFDLPPAASPLRGWGYDRG